MTQKTTIAFDGPAVCMQVVYNLPDLIILIAGTIKGEDKIKSFLR